jgi:hypothetical protein
MEQVKDFPCKKCHHNHINIFVELLTIGKMGFRLWFARMLLQPVKDKAEYVKHFSRSYYTHIVPTINPEYFKTNRNLKTSY